MESYTSLVHSMLLLAVLIAFAESPTWAQTTDAPISENINNDGNITWADLPAGKPYVSPSEYDEGDPPLPGIWNLMYGFLDTIAPRHIDYGIIPEYMNNGTSIDNLQDDLMNNIDVFLGIAICIVLGFLFLLIFPLVCCCFCCCRMCGNCGGKMYQKQSSNMCCKKVTYSVILFSVTAILAGGVACGYFVSERQTDVIENFSGNLLGSIDDMLNYINNTVDEVEFIAVDQTTWAINQILDDFSDIGGVLGVAIKDQLGENVQPAIDSMINMVDNIQVTNDGLKELDVLAGVLNTDYTAYATSVSDFKSDLDTEFTSCGTTNCPSERPDTSVLTCSRDFSMFVADSGGTYPDGETVVAETALDSLLATNPKAEAEAGEQMFEDIPARIQNETKDAVDMINSTLSGFLDMIDGALEPMIDQISGMTSQIDGFRDEDTINGFNDMAAQYDLYRSYFMSGIGGIVLLVVLFNFLGILFGIIGHKSGASPTQRSGLSNCGGLFLMASAGFCFIFACFYMFLTTFPFLIGAPLQKFVCKPILSGDLWEQTIDKYDGWSEGYFLGDLVFQNSSIELTMTGVLKDCGDNKTPYKALKLDNLNLLDQYLDFEQYLNASEFDDMKNVDFSNIEIMSDETEDNLNDFKNAGVQNIDWTAYEAELNDDLTDYGDDLTGFADLIKKYIDDNNVPDPHYDNINTIVDAILAFQDTGGDGYAMIALRDDMKTKLADHKVDAGNIDSDVTSTITDGNAADQFIQDELSGIISEQVDNYFERIMSYLGQFVAYIKRMLEEDLAKCRPLANFINNIFNTICRDFLDPFNGFWFVNGWCVFFFMPSIIFGVKLAKFLRKMKEDDSFDDGMEMKSMPPSNGAGPPFSNKVGSGNVNGFTNPGMTISEVEMQGI